MWHRLGHWLLPVLILVAFGGVWQLIALFYPPALFPGPTATIEALIEVAINGTLWSNTWISLVRFFTGYGLALLIAIPLGLLFGCVGFLRRLFDPLIQVLRPISPIAWSPLAVLWFGIGSAPAIYIIFLACFFPMLLTTITAVKSVPAVYLKVARNFGVGSGMTVLLVILPAAFPGIMSGLHIAVGTGWIHLVAGEMLGAQSGLGYMIVDARNFLRTDMIMAGMLVIGVLGLGIYRGMRALEDLIGRQWGIGV
ncbi:ABC transporter permease [Rhabdochromatium marinum]|uniref:ABC transporter permease n=1 Tax=Rhabdochromatium marinum TaxID=48729 RepID=UPI001906BBB7|nr:ABC transporter permease [Rhabdochromatium marinum]MBK1647690.1 sulfonate ABC transporter permease [Rhabdochromatium marinum]